MAKSQRPVVMEKLSSSVTLTTIDDVVDVKMLEFFNF
jgi:hypothetical protein